MRLSLVTAVLCQHAAVAFSVAAAVAGATQAAQATATAPGEYEGGPSRSYFEKHGVGWHHFHVEHHNQNIQFDVAPSPDECFGEEIAANSVFKAAFEVVSGLAAVSMKVISPSGKVMVKHGPGMAGGNVTLTHHESKHTNVHFCFSNSGEQAERVRFTLASGIHVNDTTDVIKHEDVKPIEVEVKKLEEAVTQVWCRVQGGPECGAPPEHARGC